MRRKQCPPVLINNVYEHSRLKICAPAVVDATVSSKRWPCDLQTKCSFEIDFRSDGRSTKWASGRRFDPTPSVSLRSIALVAKLKSNSRAAMTVFIAAWRNVMAHEVRG